MSHTPRANLQNAIYLMHSLREERNTPTEKLQRSAMLLRTISALVDDGKYIRKSAGTLRELADILDTLEGAGEEKRMGQEM